MLEISVSKINKDYGFGKILNDVSFEVMNGDIYHDVFFIRQGTLRGACYVFS